MDDLLDQHLRKTNSYTLKIVSLGGKSINQLKTIFNLDAMNLSHVQFSKEMSTYYSGKLMNQLMHIRNNETGKLRFFSKILTTFEFIQSI